MPFKTKKSYAKIFLGLTVVHSWVIKHCSVWVELRFQNS